MKNLLFLLLCSAGCDKEMMGTPDMAVNIIPTPPILGFAIDRMGRPAINTALNNTFNPNDTQKGIAKDNYNGEVDEATWATLIIEGKPMTKEFAGNLAVIDSLDAVCGNQLLAAGDSSGDAGAAEYAALPAVLVDDQLYLDTSVGDCKGTATLPNYLAVEARSLGLPLTACGGRTPLDDVIDITFTLLASGGTTPVTDGVNADADPATAASLTDFPFLNSPNN
jgi:hypothetical protein